MRHRERVRERELRNKLKKEGKLEEYLRKKGELLQKPELVKPISVDLDIQRYKETKMVGDDDGSSIVSNVPKFSVDAKKVEKILKQMRRRKSLKIEEYREEDKVQDNGEFRPKLAGKTGLPVFFFKNLVNQNLSAFQKFDARNRNRKFL